MNDIIYTKHNKYCIIRFNRPWRKNAITTEMFEKFQEYLKVASEDDDIMIVIVTGTGEYFTSGNDLNNFLRSGGFQDSNVEEAVKRGRDGFHKFVKTLIDYPKILMAIVNGPAIGIGVTMLGLFDVVFASNTATFYTPFAGLGQRPEGCSSYTFPRMMGFSKTTELLIFGRKMTATEAHLCGLVSNVYRPEEIGKIWDIINHFCRLQNISVFGCKNSIRQHDKEKLHQVNDMECDALQKVWVSDEFFTAIGRWFNRSKL